MCRSKGRSAFCKLSMPSRLFSIIFGLAPCSYSNRSSLIYIPYTFTLIGFVFYTFFTPELERSPLRYLQDVLNVSTLAILLLTSVFSRRNIGKTLVRLRNVQWDLVDFRYDNKYSALAHGWMLGNFAATAFVIYARLTNDPDGIYYSVTYYFPNFVQNIYAFHFNVCVFVICLYLKHLKMQFGGNDDGSNQKLSRDDIMRLRVVYSKIWLTARLINVNCNVPLVFIFANTLMNITDGIYDWLITDYTGKVIELVESIIWILINAIRVVFITHVCEDISNQIQGLAEAIHKKLLKTENLMDNCTILQFSLQLIHENIEIWPCGLFKINNRIIYGMIGAATTYSVLIFQLGGSNIQHEGN